MNPPANISTVYGRQQEDGGATWDGEICLKALMFLHVEFWNAVTLFFFFFAL